MNFVKMTLDPARCESCHAKLALMTLCAIGITAAIGLNMTAQAADLSAVVPLGDLNLSTDSGMQAARERVHQTARRLCDRAVDPWSLSRHVDYVRCVDEAMTAGVGQLQRSWLVAGAKAGPSGHSDQ
jgi:UrcA family protein